MIICRKNETMLSIGQFFYPGGYPADGLSHRVLSQGERRKNQRINLTKIAEEGRTRE